MAYGIPHVNMIYSKQESIPPESLLGLKHLTPGTNLTTITPLHGAEEVTYKLPQRLEQMPLAYECILWLDLSIHLDCCRGLSSVSDKLVSRAETSEILRSDDSANLKLKQYRQGLWYRLWASIASLGGAEEPLIANPCNNQHLGFTLGWRRTTPEWATTTDLEPLDMLH